MPCATLQAADWVRQSAHAAVGQKASRMRAVHLLSYPASAHHAAADRMS